MVGFSHNIFDHFQRRFPGPRSSAINQTVQTSPLSFKKAVTIVPFYPGADVEPITLCPMRPNHPFDDGGAKHKKKNKTRNFVLRVDNLREIARWTNKCLIACPNRLLCLKPFLFLVLRTSRLAYFLLQLCVNQLNRRRACKSFWRRCSLIIYLVV